MKNKLEELVLALDIGGTNIPVGLVDKNGTIRYEWSIKMKGLETPQDLIYKVVEFTEDYKDSIIGIGIGAPNGNFYSGAIEFAPNLPWKGKIPLAQLFQDQFDVPCYLTNDANAAAIGEMLYGSAKGINDFLMITLGTGVGSAFISNGKLIYGHDGFAGELGHSIVKLDGRLCGCGRNGCLETYASATGVTRTAKRLIMDTMTPSKLRDVNTDDITSKMVIELAMEGDAMALEVVDYTANILGLALANAVSCTSPAMIVFSGGLSRAGDILMNPVRKYMEDYLFLVFKNKITLAQSALLGQNVAVIGAAALCWNELNSISND